MLERIVYVSAARELQDPERIAAILGVARSRNEVAGITGLLVGGGHWWLQVLEGERNGLDPVWQSIRNDPRHSPIILVQRRLLAAREFAGWRMQFREAEEEAFGGLVEKLTGGVADLDLRHQIRRFHERFIVPGRPWSDMAA